MINAIPISHDDAWKIFPKSERALQAPDDAPLFELQLSPRWVDLCAEVGDKMLYLTTRPA